MDHQKLITTVKPLNGPKALGPYSAGKIVSSAANMVYLSGAIGINQEGNLVSEDVVEQTRQAFNNVGILLEAANSDYQHVVKCTVYLLDMGDFAKVNEEYAKFFKEEYPARVCIAVQQLPKNAKVEIEVIAIEKQRQ